MIVISYDISNDKLRTRFSKYLSRFGHRIQYSVFEIDNSESFLSNIEIDIKLCYCKPLSLCDIITLKLLNDCLD